MKMTFTKVFGLLAVVALLSSCSTYQNLATNWKYRNEYRQSKVAEISTITNASVKETGVETAKADTKSESLLSVAVQNEEVKKAQVKEQSATASVSKTAALLAAAKMVKLAKKVVSNPEFKLKGEETKISPASQNEVKQTQRRGGVSKFLLISIILMLIGLLVAFLLNYIVGIIIFIVGAVIFFYWLFTTM